MSDFREDLGEIYKKAGLENKSVVFLLDDSQIVTESQLEDINSVLNSGVVPNLFEPDDFDQVMAETRAIINKEGAPVDVGSKDAVHRFFIDRVRDNLHVVLCLSPSGDQFRARLRTFPALVTSLTIDWYKNWPSTALADVASSILGTELANIDLSVCYARGGADLAARLAPVAAEVHASVEATLQRLYTETRRRHFVPPACFLELLGLYSKNLEARIQEISARLNQLVTGVQKLVESKAQVEVLQKEQEALAPQLAEAAESTAKLIAQLSTEKASVDQLRQVAVEEETVVKVQARDTEMIAQDAQRDLDQCMPMLVAANKALDSLNANDIMEIRSFKQPPSLVKVVMEAVCILRGVKPDWESAKKLLNEGRFLQNLIEYDKDNISDAVLRQLKKYTSMEDFVPEKVEKQSYASKSLCFWVRSLEKYAYTIREVEPKRRRLEAAKADLEQKQAALAEKQSHLAQVEAELKKLEDTFEAQNREKQRLEQSMELTKARLRRAEQLTGALADERERWARTSEELRVMLQTVPGDTFLASCAVAYLGVFTSSFRASLIAYWHDVLEAYGVRCSPLAEVRRKGLFGLLSSDEALLESWRSRGLPSDAISTDNAVIITRSRRFCLILDPQGQAATWIRGLERDAGLMVVKPSQPGLLRIFESAIRSGIPVLLDGVGETIEPSLKPILERDLISVGNRMIIKLNDSDVEWHPDFRLYVTTKLPNPSLSPELHAKLTIVNFTISSEALEDQLLRAVVSAEYPELEARRVELANESSRDQLHLARLADQILQELTTFKGSVLDNENLIRVLGESKQTSADMEAKELQSRDTRREIERYYAIYRPVSVRCALIYFAVSDMALVEPMYLFALSYFIRLFQNGIAAVEAFRGDRERLGERVEALIERVTYSLFSNISRGVFEKDKMVFAFLLASRILQRAGKVGAHEWSLFLQGVPKAEAMLGDEYLLGSMGADQRAALEAASAALRGLGAGGSAAGATAGAFAEGASAGANAEGALPDDAANDPHAAPDEENAAALTAQELTVAKACALVPDLLSLSRFVTERGAEVKRAIQAHSSKADAFVRSLFAGESEIDRLFAEGGYGAEEAEGEAAGQPEGGAGDEGEAGAAPDAQGSPAAPRAGLSPFRKLLLLRALAEELVVLAVPMFIDATLGPRYSSLEPPMLADIHADSSETTPIIFLLSTGADPLSQLQALAAQQKQQLHLVSLGQGQGPVARSALESATAAGSWVFLQNAHLARTWMPELEATVEQLSAEESTLPWLTVPPRKTFRLFLSSMPADHFPASVLQTSLKVTTEPPSGLRNNVLRMVGQVSEADWEAEEVISSVRAGYAAQAAQAAQAAGQPAPAPEDNPAVERMLQNTATTVKATWKRLFYALIFFHGVLLERRKFGPQAFNVRYEFNESDFSVCTTSLRNFIGDAALEYLLGQAPGRPAEAVSLRLPWDAISFLLAKIHYGGRITDSWDFRAVNTLLQSIINSSVISDLNGTHAFVPSDRSYDASFTAASSFEELRQLAQRLPSVDGTDVFGMSENSLVVCRRAESLRLLSRVLDIGATSVGSAERGEGAEGAEGVEGTAGAAGAEGAEGAGGADAAQGAEPPAPEAGDSASAPAPAGPPLPTPEQLEPLRAAIYTTEARGLTQDQIVDGICAQLLARLPEPMSVEKEACTQAVTYSASGTMHCLSVVLLQEVERFNQLLVYLRRSLEDVRLAIQGVLLLTVDLEQQYRALSLSRVPEAWSRLAYPSLKPLTGWFEDLLQRVAFMRSWLREGPPQSFWLSGFYFPQGFVTGVLQMHAREHRVSVDSLGFDFRFLAPGQPARAPPAGVLVHGLYLDCGFFDAGSGKLVPARRGILYPRLPTVHFSPVDLAQRNARGYSAPIYKTSERAGVLSSTGHSTNHIMPMTIPTDESPEFFIRQGTAVLCQLDD